MPKPNPQELQALMDQFYGGSDSRYRHSLFRRFIYTEGVRAVDERAGCYWLLDIVATEVAPRCLKVWERDEIGVFMLELTVTNSTASLRCTWDDEEPAIWTRGVDWTDFPEGEWTFKLVVDGLVDPPHEVLVMCLLQED